MADTHVTITGNLTDDPEVTFTPDGAAGHQLPGGRHRPPSRTARAGSDGDTSFYRITAWRQLAEHVGDSLGQGRRVMVVGQLRARSWETPEGDKRTVVEVRPTSRPLSRWATAKPERARSQRQASRPVQRRPAVLTPGSSEAGADLTRPGLAHHRK